MENSKKNIAFRTSVGGFKKRDVINYISDSSKKHAEERASLLRKNEELTKKLREGDVKLLDIQVSLNKLIKEKEAELEAANARIAEFEAEIEKNATSDFAENADNAEGTSIREISNTAETAEISTHRVDEVSKRAIGAIRAINADVRSYMDGCVDEFGSYTQDVTDSITRLLREITVKCSELDERIASKKKDAASSIDTKYEDFTK